MSNIGRNIYELRISRGYTQDQMAEALNTTKQAISNYELGKREPDAEMLARVAEYFGVSVEDVTKNIPDETKVQPRRSVGVRSSIDLNKLNEKVFLDVTDGYLRLYVNGRSGDFASLYRSLSQTNKKFVIQGMMRQAGIRPEDLKW